VKLENVPEQLFAAAVGMDPILDGFSDVLVEIYRERDPSGRMRYVLLETASATGNRLLRFTSADPSLVARILLREIGSIRGLEGAQEGLLRQKDSLYPKPNKALEVSKTHQILRRRTL
jgi:hypothetical protein